VVDSEEIVVLARKLRALQIHFSPSKKNGVFAAKGCRVMKSTDDPEIDAIGCAAAEHCSAPGFATQSLFVACIKSWGRQQIVALADRRSLARDAQ
jgi:hypothetical protein